MVLLVAPLAMTTDDGSVKRAGCSAVRFTVTSLLAGDGSDTVTVQKIRDAIQAAYEKDEGKLRGSGKTVPPLSSIHSPLRDGDRDKADDPAYKNAWFLNATAKTRPGIVDANLQEITDPAELYSGIIGRASVNFYAYNSNGNRGIGCGLNNLQKLKDGTPLGSFSRAADDFAGLDDGEEDFLG